MVLHMLETLLTQEGYQVIKAHNGLEAFEIITERNDIDLMLLDYLMPELNGTELLDLLAANRIQIPTILITGFMGQLKDELKVKDLPMLSKPFKNEELLKQVKEGLKK